MFTESVLPRWFKQVVGFVGLLLALPGVLITFGYLFTILVVIIDYDPEALTLSFIACGLAIVTLGTGVPLFWHSLASLKGKLSRTFQLPSKRVLIVGLILYWVLGAIIFENNVLAGMFLPATLIVAVTVLPFVAIAVFIKQKSKSLTWRRSLVAFMSSATLSLVAIIFLQTVLLIVFSLLQSNPINGANSYFIYLGNLLNYRFSQRYQTESSIFILTQLTIILPLVVTLTKSLTVLPLIGQFTQYETFLIGAISGVGYAVVESLFYIGLSLEDWMWIIVVLAIGAAIHPLGGGLMTMGWRDFMASKNSDWSNLLAYVGVVSALHILWNLGFITLFVQHPFNVSGAQMLTFVLLVGLGTSSFWIGRTITRRLYFRPDQVEITSDSHWFDMENRSLAVWALSSLLAIVTVGVFAMRFVF